MIEVTNFTKVYDLSRKQMTKQKTKSKKKVAVRDVSLLAKDGEIFGLLGPNGAGKTTTLRTIATLLMPTEGSIKVNGFDVVKDSTNVRRVIGFLTNDLKLETHFTPTYTMAFFGKLHNMDEVTIERRMQELFSYFGITPFKDQKIGELSTGMTQKLSIAVSLIHDPQVVIFDEPTNGLDIITAKAVTEYLIHLKEQGKLVVVSTHIMEVAERLCDRIAIIINGQKVADGTLEEICLQEKEENLEGAFFSLYSRYSGEVD